MRTATVVLSAEHPTYREGLAEAIGDHAGLNLVAVCADAESAFREIVACKPAVGLLDVALRPLSGLELCRLVQRSAPDVTTRFVLMSSGGSAVLDGEARAAGAVLVVDKDTPRARLCELLVEVATYRTASPVMCR